ncbi:MAG TPA: P1 family peptidase [Vicinamibacterales bacterium]|nr:P1 family peptidase [Vicinamibacterales bacterium]
MKLTRRAFASTIAAAACVRGVLEPELGAQGGAGSLTDVPGLRVGHWTDTRRPTGCTAILFDPDASAGVDYDGSAPGETGVALLQPVSPVESIHGLFLSGGGQFGLGAHAGMIRYLEDQKRGFDWGGGVRVPIAPGAVIDDLALGDPAIRPDPQAAYRACEAASGRPVAEGNVGAGAGATVGRMLRAQTSGGMKGGLGTASLRLGDLVIGALAVVNAAGDVLDWRTGRIVAGARQTDGRGFADTVAVIKRAIGAAGGARGVVDDPALRSTTLIVVATNLALTKVQLTKVAMMANCGAARGIRPYHTTGDGDQLFAVSTRSLRRDDVNVTMIGALAAEVVADAILRGVMTATSVEGWPAARDI